MPQTCNIVHYDNIGIKWWGHYVFEEAKYTNTKKHAMICTYKKAATNIMLPNQAMEKEGWKVVLQKKKETQN